MAERHEAVPGLLCWCDASRSNIGLLFSDKERRPVLVVELLQGTDYLAVYPCTRKRDKPDRCEWIGAVLGDADTYVIFGDGLFFVPRADLLFPGAMWSQWRAWRRAHDRMITEDRRLLLDIWGYRLVPGGETSRPDSSRFASSIGNLIDPASAENLRCRAATPEPPPPAPRAPQAPPAPSTIDPFLAAIDALDADESLMSAKNEGSTPDRPAARHKKQKPPHR